MQFFSSLLVGATALVSLVAAQNPLYFTSTPGSVEAGNSYTITYESPNPGENAEIILREGPSGNLNTITTLTTTATGGSYTWDVSDDLFNSGSYALEIRQAGQIPNFSGQFALTGGDGESPVSTIATPSSTPVETSTPVSTAESTLITTESTAVTSTLITVTSSFSNSTLPTQTPTSTPSTTSHSASETPSATGPDGSAPTTGAAAPLKSPAALVLGAFVALAYLQ